MHVARGQSRGPEVGPTVGEVHFEAGVVVGRTLACGLEKKKLNNNYKFQFHKMSTHPNQSVLNHRLSSKQLVHKAVRKD